MGGKSEKRTGTSLPQLNQTHLADVMSMLSSLRKLGSVGSSDKTIARATFETATNNILSLPREELDFVLKYLDEVGNTPDNPLKAAARAAQAVLVIKYQRNNRI